MPTHSQAAPWIIMSAGVVAAMHIGKLPPSLPILQEQLQLNLNHIGFLLSAIQAAGMLCALIIGTLAGRVGLKRMLLGGLLVLALASALGALSTHFYALFAARLLEGFGFLCVILPAPALLRQLAPPSQLKAMMAYWGTYMGFGVALSLLITPLALQIGSWSQVWLGFSALAVVMLFCIAKTIHVPEAATQNMTAMSVGQVFQHTVRHAPSWLLGLVFATYTSQWFAIMGFLPTIYAQADVGATQAGVLTALVCLSNVIGSVLSGTLMQRGWRAIWLLSIGFGVMMAGTVLMFAGVGLWPFAWQYIGVLAFSMVGGLIPAVVFAYASVLAGSAQMVAGSIGWIQQWSSMGQFVLPPLMGAWVIWWGGWQQVWVICVSLSVLGLIGSVLIQKRIDQSVA